MREGKRKEGREGGRERRKEEGRKEALILKNKLYYKKLMQFRHFNINYQCNEMPFFIQNNINNNFMKKPIKNKTRV